MIKYEFKQMSPVLLVAFIALFFVTLIGFLIGVLPILIFGGKDLGTGIWSIFMVSISFLAYALILMVIAIGMNIFIGYRFYKSMYSSTGYLTHTLPLSTNELILGKTIPAIAVQILIDLMVIISGVIIFLGYYVAKDGFDNAIYNISSLLQIFEGRYFYTGFGIVLAVTMFGISAVIQTVSGTFVLLLSASIGQLFNSHRILMGVVSFIVINRIIAAFEWIINLIVTEVAKADYYSRGTGTIISLILIAIINIAVLIISYVLNYYIISNKLNLE
jgi:hypothetical protein